MSTADLPRKMYVELTTRCNLQCRMCVKHTAGNAIPEMDMDIDVFARLRPVLGSLHSLVLNGIGESLLHPRLPEIIAQARSAMNPSATIGLQSNGLLLTRDTVIDLVERGLTTLCLSVDSFEGAETLPTSPREHSFAAVERATGWIADARRRAGSNFSLGLEIVLTFSTLGELAPMVRWAVGSGVDYILVSHLISYDREAERASLFNPQPLEAVQLYGKYRDMSESMGISFGDAFTHHRKTAGTRTDPRFSRLFGQLLRDARSRDLRINFDHIGSLEDGRIEEISAIFADAEVFAAEGGIDLQLPPLHAQHPRRCRFIDEKAIFISVAGEVMPCHFLWHSYACRMYQEEIQVRKRVFGNIRDQELDDIWRRRSYADFRAEADSGEYSPCWSCPQGPCPSLVNDETGYGNDCYGSSVPCGHCPWNLGGFRCL